MSNQDIKQISNATGTFQSLQHKAKILPPGGKVAPETGEEPPAKLEKRPDLEVLTEKLNVTSQSIGRDLRFKVDIHSGRSVIQVLDRDTGEIVREIPPEYAQISVSGNGNVELRLYDESA